MEACLESMGYLIKSHDGWTTVVREEKMIDYIATEKIWSEILKEKGEWITLRPRNGQPAVGDDSRWLPFERPE